MARPKHTTDIDVNSSAAEPAETIQERDVVLSEQVRLERIDHLISAAGEYNLAAEMQAARCHAGNAAASMMLVARSLMRIKEREGKQVFDAFVFDQLGISVPYAHRLCACYLKFNQRPELQNLQASKLLALMPLDNDSLDAITDGSIEDFKLDDVDRMTAAELRKAVKDLREDAEITREKLTDARAGKDEALDRLERRDRDMEKKSARMGALIGTFQTTYSNVLSALTQYREATDAISDQQQITTMTTGQEEALQVQFADAREVAIQCGIARNTEGFYL